MVFSSFVFLIFFLPLLLVLYYTVCYNNPNRQNVLLLIASLFFYSWGEPTFVFAMLACIVAIWAFSRFCIYIDTGGGGYLNSHKLRKIAFWLTIIAVLGLLIVVKYAAFAIININRLPFLQLPVPHHDLPIGISFFTFKAMSYTIDVYRRTIKPEKSLLCVALYISLFPQLMAGPIVRYQTIQKDLHDRKFSWDDFTQGVSRFIIGLGKKVVIANTIALAADYAFAKDPSTLSVTAAWLGALAYGLQIYFDFSGYSDMAIGLGRMFGFHFLENFNYPYISRSISEFWRRWHISMSSWFRDYIYFPLGGSRVKSRWRLIFNLFVVWALTGLWHGASWTFVAWGLLFFFLVTFEKLTGFGKLTEKLPAIGNVYVIICLLIGWVIFRATNESEAVNYLQAMFGLSANPLIGQDTYRLANEYVFTWIIGIIGCIPLVKWLSAKRFYGTLAMSLLKWAYLAFVFLLSIVLISGSDYNPFIYFNF